jgi:hypothetical protein
VRFGLHGDDAVVAEAGRMRAAMASSVGAGESTAWRWRGIEVGARLDVTMCRSGRGSRALCDIADAPHETAAVRADVERLASVFVCLWLAGSARLAGRLELKQAAHTRERLVSVRPWQGSP